MWLLPRPAGVCALCVMLKTVLIAGKVFCLLKVKHMLPCLVMGSLSG